MSVEKKTYRLFKVAKELNVGSNTLVDFLNAKGHSISNDPNEKISADIYETLLNQFGSEKKLKERVEQIREFQRDQKAALPEEGVEQEPEKEQEILTAAQLRTNVLTTVRETAKEEPAERVAPQVAKAVEVEAPNTEKAETPTEVPVEPAEPEKPGLKVVGKIDLSQFDKKKKPAKPEPVEAKGAKTEAPVELPATQPTPEVPQATEPVRAVQEDMATAPAMEAEKPAEAEVAETIRAKDHAPKLQGLKVMGKIELPTDRPRKKEAIYTTKEEKAPDKAAADKADDASKRKRKRTRKPTGPGSGPGGGSGAGQGGSRGTAPRREEVSGKDVQSNIRNTMAQLGRGTGRKRQIARRDKRDKRALQREQREMEIMDSANVLEVTEFLTANELASLMDVSVNQVIAKCLEAGLFVSINQRLDKDVILLLADEFDFHVNFISADEALDVEDAAEDDPETLLERSPIITVMGHVDHGKTSLLDYIRKANVIAGEAGGITQHIGAYEVTRPDGRSITFLDTPGHEAFTAMRARGAQVTDIAIIIIAADDQVMPQTREAINHAQAAGVPMVFAINKVDKPGAEPEKIRSQLAEMNLLVEDWGGKYQCQEISAKKGTGVEELLEKVLLEADMLELKANPDRPARGTVIEAQLDKGRGVVTTILVQTGTLRIGDVIVANQYYGRVKAMLDEREHKVGEAGPSKPVQILGLDGVPQAGDKFQVMETDRDARELAGKRARLSREQSIRMTKHVTLEEIARRAAVGDFKELNLIVKGDVDGSVEALADSLIKLSTDEVAVNIVMKGVGQITESDVLLASASNAMIIGFQVRPSAAARKVAAQEKIDIRLYSVIYNAINEIRDAMEGLLSPDIEEQVTGTAEVRDVFRISKVGAVAGCMVIDGTIARNNLVRLIRDGVVVYNGKILALKRFKDDVKEVAEGYECGISIENFNDIKVGDNIECYTTKEVKRTLE
ncbi:MAG: translation initiation factor IF-2 [Bacteroidetes bacterium]|jgi:translation initiation factor IF-2|nr:translation initiation factor IF-2 [Bacteroidota bacterium]